MNTCQGTLIHSALGTRNSCLAHEVPSKCLLKITAVIETCTHIHRRLWRGSGTSCYHRAVSVEPCRRGRGRGREKEEEGEGEQRVTRCLAVRQRNQPCCTQQIKVGREGGGRRLWLPLTCPFSVTPQVSLGGTCPSIVPLWLGCRWMITQYMNLAEKWSCDPTWANENQPWDFCSVYLFLLPEVLSRWDTQQWLLEAFLAIAREGQPKNRPP